MLSLSLSLSLSDFGFNCLRFILQFFNSQLIGPRAIAQFLAEYKKQYSTYAFLFYLFIIIILIIIKSNTQPLPFYLFVYYYFFFYKFNHTLHRWIKTFTNNEF